MSVAIVTKYHGPTNYRGSRITATVPERIAHRDLDQPTNPLHQRRYWTLTIPYPYELSGEDVHRLAAQALADRLEWTGALAGGALAEGYAFVFVGDPGRMAPR